MDQCDFSLIKKMNIQTDTVVGNQTDKIAREIIDMNGHKVTYISYIGKGIGLNRNKVIENSCADICVFADDDMRFVEGYPEIVKNVFKEVVDADVIIFNLIEKETTRYVNTKIKKIRMHNYAKYGAARFVIKRESIANSGITFNLQFGGGTKYGSGEDTIFLKECIKKGLKVVAVPYAIAEIDQTADSTWFKGYNKKFFADKGALYSCLYSHFAWCFCIRYLLKYHKKYCKSIPMTEAFSCMKKGIQEYSKENL